MNLDKKIGLALGMAGWAITHLLEDRDYFTDSVKPHFPESKILNPNYKLFNPANALSVAYDTRRENVKNRRKYLLVTRNFFKLLIAASGILYMSARRKKNQ